MGGRVRRIRIVPLMFVLLVGSALATYPTGSAIPMGTQLPPSPIEEDEALVEIHLPNRLEVDRLVAMGTDLAEYLRENEDGTVTVAAFLTRTERVFLESMGYRMGVTIEDRSTWEERKAERREAMQAEKNAHEIAEKGLKAEVDGIVPRRSASSNGSEGADSSATTQASQEEPPGEVTIMRADYFVHRSGRFLSVEARTDLGTNSGGPTLAVSWAEEGGAFGTATTMSKFTDSGAYMYHRVLLRIGAAGSTSPVPAMVQVASSTGELADDTVSHWPGPGLPAYADGYISDFIDYYMDPVQVHDRINALAAEFPNLAEIIDLPHKTGGYQRKAMAVMEGTTDPGAAPAQAARAVLLISNAWGHEGGNDISAEFVAAVPAPSSPTVSVTGKKITVTLAVGGTAADVVQAINGLAAASELVTAYTYGGNAGTGIVPPRLEVNLDDFLNAPASVPRGPFQPQAIRIGSHRDGSKVGVFLYCQQHAREWVTPLTCVETAERLLRNYVTDSGTKEMVDNLDIFIIPSYNPDGSLYSMYDSASQRKNLTQYCGLTASNGMPSSRNSWGVDNNRNNSIGTRLDGFSGASSSCTSETYSGPAELSEPENKNEEWLVETFTNIKFSNNIHSFGGYFMWAPGAYVAAGRVTLPAPNIGVEGYFFEGAEKILSRIEEYRGTVILPSRTGPVADVLYSAAGNSADEQWYRRDIIAYSFETGADLFVSDQTGTTQNGVGFQPDYATEGHHEAMEFAAGNYGLFETALDYAFDTEPPVADIKQIGGEDGAPFQMTFDWVNEPSVIHYTTDGSSPTKDSTTWEAQGPRRPGEWLTLESGTILRWIAIDIRGNVSPVQSAGFGCTIEGTVGNDILVGTAGHDIICGLAGNDRIEGGAGDDVLLGGNGIDSLSGSAGADHADGGAGNDTLTGGAGADTLIGGANGDTATYGGSPTGVTVDLSVSPGTGSEGDAEGDSLTGIENLWGTGHIDTLIGSSGPNTIRGFGSGDTLKGLGGTDTLDYRSSTAGVTIDLRTSPATVTGGHAEGDVATLFERVIGSSWEDVLHGNNLANWLLGAAGNDSLFGYGGNDRLLGQAGVDSFDGGPGTDFCDDATGETTVNCE